MHYQLCPISDAYAQDFGYTGEKGKISVKQNFQK